MVDNFTKLLDDWKDLNTEIHKFTIDELRSLINYEISTRNRASFIGRMHQRYSKLVTILEREHILKGNLL
jgi:hypothetical protein